MSHELIMARIVFLLCGGLAFGPSFATGLREFDVPAGAADMSLPHFATQAGLSLLFDSDVLKSFSAHAAKGRLDPATALSMMLKDSGLEFFFRTATIVSVRPKPPTAGDLKEPPRARPLMPSPPRECRCVFYSSFGSQVPLRGVCDDDEGHTQFDERCDGTVSQVRWPP